MTSSISVFNELDQELLHRYSRGPFAGFGTTKPIHLVALQLRLAPVARTVVSYREVLAWLHSA